MKALEVLKKYDWNGVQKLVGWSGGRDSTGVLHLAIRAWGIESLKVVFVDTGITLPETLRYIKETSEWMGFEPTILKAELDFWKYVQKYGFPFFKRLWCRRLLKMKPIRKYLNSLPGWKINVLGIRRRESTTRMKTEHYMRDFKKHTQLKKTFILLPVRTWRKSRCKAYTKKHGIPENPAYKYYGTTGCYFCPFVTNQKHYLALKNRHPHLFDKLLQAERSIKSDWSVFKDKPTIESLAKQQFLEVSE